VKVHGTIALQMPNTDKGVAIVICNSIRVLCVDDHPLMRDGIAFALQSQKDMELVGQAVDGEEALRLFRQLRPDVTLMDLQMPGINGIATIEAIKKEFPKARIVVLTTYSGDVQAARALKAGAVGYLLKSMLRNELLGTIRTVHAGGRRIPPEIASDLAEHISADALSEREIQVLGSVAAGCSNKMVADELAISEDTVKGHMKNILCKLDANDRTQAVLIAIRRGFLDG
jgi:DNA-binding NarL/FixJ family response regulator